MCQAAISGDVKTIIALIEQGADINSAHEVSLYPNVICYLIIKYASSVNFNRKLCTKVIRVIFFSI